MHPPLGERQHVVGHGVPVDAGVLDVDAAAGEVLGVVLDQLSTSRRTTPCGQLQRMALAELVEEGLLALLARCSSLFGAQAPGDGVAQLRRGLEVGAHLRANSSSSGGRSRSWTSSPGPGTGGRGPGARGSPCCTAAARGGVKVVSWPADSPWRATVSSSQTRSSPTSTWTVLGLRLLAVPSFAPSSVISAGHQVAAARRGARPAPTRRAACAGPRPRRRPPCSPGSTGGSGRSKSRMLRSSICGRVSTVAMKVRGSPGWSSRTSSTLGRQQRVDGGSRPAPAASSGAAGAR